MDPIGFWKLIAGLAFMVGIFWFLYFRNRSGPSGTREERKLQQAETKLKSGVLEPAHLEFKVNRPVQLLIHRFDLDPADEIFEIAELEIYELLPAGHTTVIAFLPERKGKFKIILGAEREAGVVRVA